MTRALHVVGIVLFLASVPAVADTVDDFTVPQGPLTLGPGDVPSEDEATIRAPGVLGGFRVMTPAVDEAAPPGAQATAEIGGGVFRCSVRLQGGCASAWADAEDGNTFDFTDSEAVEIEVLEAAPRSLVAVFLVDGTVDVGSVIGSGVTNGVVAFLESPAPGRYSLPLTSFLSPTNPVLDFDFGAVTNVVLVAAFEDGFDGDIRFGPVTTTGPIGQGPQVDPPGEEPPPDDELINFVSGTYFNLARDGEGCQVSLEGDGETVVLSCYLYQDGEQAWIIGSGVLVDGQIVFDDIVITEGADFGEAFDRDDVSRTPWGTVTMAWSDCNNATITLSSDLAEFPEIVIPYTKVTRADCSGSGPAEDVLLNQGTLFNPARDGEGFQIAAQGDSPLYVITWYTYLDGRQVWLIGTGRQDGNRIVFDDLITTRGADFGPGFDATDVVREPWGTLTLEYSDCNNATASAVPLPQRTAFDAFEFQVRKLVAGTCP